MVLTALRTSSLAGAPGQGGQCPLLRRFAGRQNHRRGAEAVSHGPDCSSDHRDSPVAFRQDGLCPRCAGRVGSTGAVVEKTVVLPRLHSLRNSMRSDL